MSFNEPPQNPYGQQPQGDGYGQQQPPGYGGQGGYGPPQQPQPGYGYPQQQPAQPPYGQPQQQPPYGQAPPPQPYEQPGYGYGQPPYQPVPPQGGKGKRTGIIAGIVVVLVAIGVGAYVVAGSGGGSRITYKLTAPHVVATVYKKSTSPDASSGGFDSKDLTTLKGLGVTNPQKVTAGYVKGTEQTGTLLQFSGVWGAVKDPKKVADGMMASMRTQVTATGASSDGSKTELVGGPQTMHPAGLDGGAVLECQNAKYTDGASKVTLTSPMCIWADSSTVGTVLTLDLSQAVGGGSGMSLDEAATLTARVREDVRVQIT
jgi:hypothetical protein